MTDKGARVLSEHAARLGVPLDATALRRLAAYLDLLVKWNARINLTRIVEEDEVVAKHFLDSLAVVPFVSPSGSGSGRLVDVGAGAGFPGVVVAIARPELDVTLVEATQKKCAFLEALKRELGLRLTIVAKRYEQFVDTPGARGGFATAVSRATFAPPEWVEKGAPLVAPGGVLIAMLGKERPALPQMEGFAAAEVVPYGLPAEGDRAVALLRRLG